MKKVLMFTDQDRLEGKIGSCEIYLSLFNDVLKGYLKLNFGPIDFLEFRELVADPECFIFDKMTGGEKIEIAGLKISKHKAIDLLEKPEGYEELIKSIEILKGANGFTFQQLNIHDLVKNEIVLSKDYIDNAKESANVYATNEKELALFEFLNRVMKDAVETFGEGSISINKLFSECLTIRSTKNGRGEDVHFYVLNYRPLKNDNFYI